MKGEPLNDLWGLRRHQNGEWDWQVAPYRPAMVPPAPRSQHSSLCYKNLFLVIGGRGSAQDQNLNLEVFNLITSEWYKLNSIDRFRHTSWIVDGKLFIHGGFEPIRPNTPTSNLFRMDLKSTLGMVPALDGILSNKNQVYSYQTERTDGRRELEPDHEPERERIRCSVPGDYIRTVGMRDTGITDLVSISFNECLSTSCRKSPGGWPRTPTTISRRREPL